MPSQPACRLESVESVGTGDTIRPLRRTSTASTGTTPVLSCNAVSSGFPTVLHNSSEEILIQRQRFKLLTPSFTLQNRYISIMSKLQNNEHQNVYCTYIVQIRP